MVSPSSAFLSTPLGDRDIYRLDKLDAVVARHVRGEDDGVDPLSPCEPTVEPAPLRVVVIREDHFPARPE